MLKRCAEEINLTTGKQLEISSLAAWDLEKWNRFVELQIRKGAAEYLSVAQGCAGWTGDKETA